MSKQTLITSALSTIVESCLARAQAGGVVDWEHTWKAIIPEIEKLEHSRVTAADYVNSATQMLESVTQTMKAYVKERHELYAKIADLNATIEAAVELFERHVKIEVVDYDEGTMCDIKGWVVESRELEEELNDYSSIREAISHRKKQNELPN